MRCGLHAAWLVAGVLSVACGDSAGGRDAGDSDGPPDAARIDAATHDSGVDAGRPPAERCAAATSERACAAEKLDILEYCDDCWHQCLWVQTHEVERIAEQCEYGAEQGVCVYQRGGEPSEPNDLADTCLGTSAFGGGTFWIDRSGSTARVAYLPTGDLTYPGFEQCGRSDAPFSLAPECECPCLPGYPDAECTVLEQGWESGIPSGIELCPGVPHHRVDAPVCVDDVAMFACSSERGTCHTDSDCTGAERCLENDYFCTCTSSCVTDADCASGEACVCHDYKGPSVCVAAHCKTDADCSNGDVCAVSYGPTDPSGSCEPKALACRTPFIECDGVRCGPWEMCVYDAAEGRWGCVDNDRCETY